MTSTEFIKWSLFNPADVSRMLMRYTLSRGTVWSMIVLVSIVSTLLVSVGGLISMGAVAADVMTPFVLSIVLMSSLTVLIFAIYLTGRMLGGTGRLDQTVLLVAWWQGIGLVIQAVQTVFLLVLPPVSGLLALIGMAWLLFALLHFVNVLHGFDSLLKSLGTVALGVVGFSFGIAIFLTLIGVGVQGGSI
ncbi:Yip1 family protein [Loktanella sp. SALINAS62]|uniref:Yip1 family protein n=1 Tax=Loktanella sp. SALINAS62 TaxID=2706124 RepID=UPI001B8D7D06|nr:YIP1 family protein [Loktanella sp. SALINAS62]